MPGETPKTCFDAPGIPSWVDGSYFVSGPAKFEVGDYKLNAIFDGLGMVNRFDLQAGQLCFASAWLTSNFYNVSTQRSCPVGPALFEDTTPSRPVSCMFPLVVSDNNWVNTIKVGDELLLLNDISILLRLDRDTLTVPGRKTWSDDDSSGNPNWVERGHIATTGSAHPLKRPHTNTYVSIAIEMGPLFEKSYVDIYSYEADVSTVQERKRIGRSGPLGHVPFVHSFGVTPNYTVLALGMGLCMTLECMSQMSHGMVHMMEMRWQGIHVIDLAGNLLTFDTDPFVSVHTVNTFENETGITMDVGAFAENPLGFNAAMDIPSFLNKTTRDNNPVLKASLRRLHMHLKGPLKGQVTYEIFDDRPNTNSDFYRINDNHNGLPYCVYWATEWWHDSVNYASMAIKKHNICTNTKTYWHTDDVYVGEPYFLPGPSGEEDDGLVLAVAHEGRVGHSKLLVLDGKTMEEVDGTSAELPTHIPFTAHGEFFPGSSSAVFV